MRYIIAFFTTVMIATVLRLAMGVEADLAMAAVWGAAMCASTYLVTRSRLAGGTGKKGLAFTVFALLFAIIFLIVEAYRVYEFVESGRLLVSTSPTSFVSWSDRPIGFIVAVAMHLFLVVLFSCIALACGLEMKQRHGSRHGSVGS